MPSASIENSSDCLKSPLTSLTSIFDDKTKQLIDEQFCCLDKKTAFCNYGSFGVVPKDVLEAQFRLMTEVESDPDLWMRLTSINLWLSNREAIATKILSTNPANLAFVTNTTSAVNAVLSSVIWESGDVIIVTNWTFSTVRVACEDIVARHDKGYISIHTIDIEYPIIDEKYLVSVFVEAVDQVSASGRNPRLAIVDVISSQPAVLFPYEEIVRRLSQLGVETLVDGAQAPGQVHINLDRLGANYFAGNLHKWFFCPKGTAVFYVAPKHQSTIRAPVVSMSGCSLSRGCRLEDPMATHFFWQGTSNNTSYGCVSKAIEFIERIGGLAKIRDFNTRMLDMAASLLLSECPSSRPYELPTNLQAPFMRNVIVTAPKLRPGDVDYVQRELYKGHQVWTAVSRFKNKPSSDSNAADDRILFRISAQVCNKLDNYRRLGTAINQFVEKGFVATTPCNCSNNNNNNNNNKGTCCH